MDIYIAPLAQPGAPLRAESIRPRTSVQRPPTRSLLRLRRILAGCPRQQGSLLCRRDLPGTGQTASAERSSNLHRAAGTGIWRPSKLALANLYHQSARDSQAIEIYTALAAKPSETVSAGVAQLDLADLYAAQGKQDQARALWAKVKDADKDGAAGSIAAQRLGAKQ